MGCLIWKKTQILIAHQKQTIDRTKKGWLAAKKSSAKDKRILHTFCEVNHARWDVKTRKKHKLL